MKQFLTITAALSLLALVACSKNDDHAVDETTGSSAATSSYGTGGAMGPAVVSTTEPSATGTSTTGTTAPATATSVTTLSTSGTSQTATTTTTAPKKK